MLLKFYLVDQTILGTISAWTRDAKLLILKAIQNVVMLFLSTDCWHLVSLR